MAIDARRPSPFASARSWVPRVLAMLCLLLLWSSASAVTWFVDSTGGNDDDPGTSWPLAFRTVQLALDDHPTILCGNLLGDDGPAFSGRADNAFHVVTAEDVDATTRLETVIIRGGHADAIGSGLDDRGGALHCVGTSSGADAGSPLLRGCRLEDSAADRAGGGVWAGERSVPVLFDCTISGCRAGDPDASSVSGEGGGLMSWRSGIVLVGCHVADCTALGPGGGASFAFGGDLPDDPAVVSSSFIANHAVQRGGAIDVNGPDSGAALGSIEITNCLVRANAVGPDDSPGLVGRGGAIGLDQADARIVNCTIADNVAIEGGGVSIRSTKFDQSIVIRNSILHGNETDPLDGVEPGEQLWVSIFSFGGIASVDQCLVEDGLDGLGGGAAPALYYGPGNIDAPPEFVDEAAGNLRLTAGSAAIDAGDDLQIPVDLFDVDGDGDLMEPTPDLDRADRVVAGLVDLGAYEFTCAADVDDTGVVDVEDLLALLAAWGTDGAGSDLAEPFDVVDTSDLLALLAAWGPCP